MQLALPAMVHSRPDRPALASAWRRLKGSAWLKSLASLKLGVSLMLLIGGVMAVATVVEARHGRDVAQGLFYQSPWFGALLLALAANIAAATILRTTLGWKKAGFVMTHVGVLTVLAGALITNRLGFEGRMHITESTTARTVTTAELVLTVERRDGAATRSIELPLPMTPVWPSRGLHHERPAGADGLVVSFEEFLPHAEWTRHYVPAAEGPAAVRLSVVQAGADDMSLWLTSHDAPLNLGDVRVRLLAARDAAHAERLLHEVAGPGVIYVTTPAGEVAVDVAAARREAIPIGQSGLTLRVLGYHPDAFVGPERKLASRSEEPRNPAVEFELTGDRGVARRTAFARFPDFGRMHARTDPYDTVQSRYEHAAPMPGGGSLDLILHENQLSFRAGGGSPTAAGPVLLGQPFAGDVLGLPMLVSEALPRARAVESPRPLPRDDAREEQPAVRLTLRRGDDTAQCWLGLDQPRSVRLADADYGLTVGHRAAALPFQLTLDKFERETYPGTDQAAMFASHVRLIDPGIGDARPTVISMNRPLRHRGYTFFQSGYERRGSRYATVLSVSRDPGKQTVYAGFGLVTIGVLLMILTKRLSRRPLQAADAPAFGRDPLV